MKKASAWGICSLLVGVPSALAGDLFSFTAPGGPIVDNNINLYPITLDDPGIPGKEVPDITSLELLLTGLSHTHPDDLDIYLIDPALDSIKIMTDRGGMADINNINMLFTDAATMLPPDETQIAASGTYKPQGLQQLVDGGFDDLLGPNSAADRWLLLIIDDAALDSGSLTSFTLRAVPEPASLSLLALGAAAAFARRRLAKPA